MQQRHLSQGVLTFSYSLSCHCSSLVQFCPAGLAIARYTYFIVVLLQRRRVREHSRRQSTRRQVGREIVTVGCLTPRFSLLRVF